MEAMIFSYDDFSDKRGFHPRFLSTFHSIDRLIYQRMEENFDKNGQCISTVLDSIKKRMPRDYYSKVYAAQTEAVSYSEYVFPAYKFILPDALMDDWLSVMDPHKSYCRDHSLHQPLTAYIVAKLLGFGKPKNAFTIGKNDLLSICSKWLLTSPKTQYLRNYFSSLFPNCERIPKSILLKISMDVFYEAAVASALFHDIGYPWQFINRLSDSIRAADFRVSEDPTINAEKVLEMINNRLLIYPFYGYSEVSRNSPISTWKAKMISLFDRSLRNTHGFPGALGFTYLQDVIRKFPGDYNMNDALFRFVMDWAALGIMMHDMPKIYMGKDTIMPENPFFRLSFETDPLSSLIATADILEEFHRPGANFSNDIPKRLDVNFEFPCDSTELAYDNDNLVINYLYRLGKDVAKNARFRKEEVENYFNSTKGFVDVSPLGIKGVKCYVSCK